MSGWKLGLDVCRRRLATLVGLVALASAGHRLAAAEFIAGADMSHLAYFESNGLAYREPGVLRDALHILTNRGLNCVRLRLFTSSPSQATADPYNFINNLDYAVPLAVRIKQAGLKLLLDFHYSDSWADPGKQTKPAAWTSLSFIQLRAQLEAYTSNSIAAFHSAGALPDYVQVGNEITQGLLWNDGKVSGSTNASWANLGSLLKAAVAGVTNATGTNPPQVIVHIDRGGDWETTRWFFDNLRHQQVPFDLLALSYYPFWHGSLSNLSFCLSNAAVRYAKPVLLVETDFPWRSSTNLHGIPATPDGQVQYVGELAKIVRRLPQHRGAGIVWWGTEYQPVTGANQAGFGNRSFFGFDGELLPVADAFGQLIAPIRLSASLDAGGLKISWPLSGAGMSLASSPNAAGGGWQNVTNAVQNTGAILHVTLPQVSIVSQFYRLQAE